MFNVFKNATAFNALLMPPFLAKAWHDWQWAEPADRLENQLTSGLLAAQRNALARWDKMIDCQLEFVRRRLHADFECAEAMTQIGGPKQVLELSADFWKQALDDYRDQAETIAALVRESVDDQISEASKLAETTGEIVEGLEETTQEAAERARARAAPTARARARAA